MWRSNAQHPLVAAHISPTLWGRCWLKEKRKRDRTMRYQKKRLELSLKMKNSGRRTRFLLMVEFIKVLHVSKDDVLLVEDPWRNLLHSTGHLPQVGLQWRKEEIITIRIIMVLFFIVGFWKIFKFSWKVVAQLCTKQVNSGGLTSWTYIHALPQVSHVGFLCLNQLCHDEPEHTQNTQQHKLAIFISSLFTRW